MKLHALLLILCCFLGETLCRKPIDIAILLDSDEFFDTVINYVEKRYSMYSEYELVPHLVDVTQLDCFKLGQILCELTSKGLYLIVGPSSGKCNEIVQSIAESLELPQLQNFWNPRMPELLQSKQQNSIILNLYPEVGLVSQALATLIKDMEWRTYTIIYENDDSLIRLQDVFKILRSDDFPITIRKLLPGDDQRALLKEIKSKSELHIILDCEVDRIPSIMKQATSYNLTQEYHNYILTSLDSHTIDYNSSLSNGANITTLRLIDPTNNSVPYVVHDALFMGKQWNKTVNMSPQNLKLEPALLYDGLILFLTAFEELKLAAQPLTATPQNCKDLTLSTHGLTLGSYMNIKPFSNGTLSGPLTGPIHFDKFGRRINFILQIVEHTKHGFRVTANWLSDRPDALKYIVSEHDRQVEYEKLIHQKDFRVASRIPVLLMSVPSSQLMLFSLAGTSGKTHQVFNQAKTRSIQGRVLPIGAPYLMYKQAAKGEFLQGNDRFEGFSMDIIDGIAEILNFKYSFELEPENNYGSYDPVKKEWNGLIRQILDRKADLAICDLTITYERGKAVDFSMPFMTLGISILFSKAVKKPPELFAFMDPLSLDIWLYMATAFVIMSILIYVAARLAPKDWENPHPCDPKPKELENIWTIRNCFWLTMGSIMCQGCDILPKGISTRMIAGMWWFFSLIITSSYTANLAAFLTNERMGPTIESAEDLAKQNEIKYGCVLGGATSSFFRDSNFSTYQKMWRQMRMAEPSVFESGNKDGVKRVLTSKRKYAFLMESSSIDYEMERNCELMQVGGWLDIKNYGIAMPTNSPYNAAISGAVLKMQEEGKLHKLKEKWWKKKHGGGKCNKEEEVDDDSAAELGIDHVGGVFVVLAAGIGIAFIIGAFEFLWNIRKLSIEEQIPPKEVLAKEILFATNVRRRKKRIDRKVELPTEDS